MSGEQRLLLVVEDDFEVAETLNDFLTDEGFRIVTARNGKEALAQLRAGLRPSAILLDLLMPEMDGWQFRQEQVADATLRDIATVIFTATSPPETAARMPGVEVIRKPIDADDAASLLYLAEKIIIVPGYGMAVAQAQHKIWELSQQLIKRDKDVKFAIHPVAGRMPGHMNVLLAEAGVPYDLIADMDDINPEFPNCDVAIVIGANDVVNPVAKTDKSSPIYGMPILDVAKAKQVIVIKRGKGTGFAGIENALFYQDNCKMLYADGQEAANKLIAGLKAVDGGSGH